MTLARWWVLHLLWLLPLVAMSLVHSHRRRQRALARFADPGLLERLTGGLLPGRRFLKAALLLCGLALMLVALAGPRWGSHYEEVVHKGVDIMIAVDVSPSMRVEDVKPSRLERARREISDLLRATQGDRVGLVAFSGTALTQCPLTLDYGAVGMFLEALAPDLIPVAGTDLGAAIETSLAGFDPKAETDKAIVLLTDGEDHEGRGREAAGKAAGKGVRIFVFGIGETAGGPVPAEDGQGGFKKDGAGMMVLSRLQEDGLRSIASATGGSYVRSVAGDQDLDLLYFDGIRTRTQARSLKSGKIKVSEERFAFFLLPALLLLLAEMLIRERRAVRALGATLLFVLAAAVRAPAAESPDDLYREGRYAEAERGYARLEMDRPSDIRRRYNRGCAAYRNRNFSGAAAAFAGVLGHADSDAMRFRAAYNLGNALFQQGDFAAAADSFRQALRHDPGSEGARRNLELSLRRQQEQKTAGAAAGDREGRPDRDAGLQGGKGEPSREDKAQSREDRDGTGRQGDGRQPRREPGPRPEAGAAAQGPRDLPGELTLMKGIPGETPGGQAMARATGLMDRKQAETLLENAREDRPRLRLPAEIRARGVRSGKDW